MTGRTDEKNDKELIQEWTTELSDYQKEMLEDMMARARLEERKGRNEKIAALTEKVAELENELKDIPILQHQVDAFQAGREDLIVAIGKRVDELEALIFRPYRLKWIDKEKVLDILKDTGVTQVSQPATPETCPASRDVPIAGKGEKKLKGGRG